MTDTPKLLKLQHIPPDTIPDAGDYNALVDCVNALAEVVDKLAEVNIAMQRGPRKTLTLEEMGRLLRQNK